MGIYDVVGNNIKACAQFEYKGWTVSMSTIFQGDVLAWDKDQIDTLEAATVEDILALIDILLS
jgi:hypothetical protein